MENMETLYKARIANPRQQEKLDRARVTNSRQRD